MKLIDTHNSKLTTTVLTKDGGQLYSAYQGPRCENYQSEYEKIIEKGQKLSLAEAQVTWHFLNRLNYRK